MYNINGDKNENIYFFTNEGYTYTGKEDSIEPDINNSQMLGIAKGNTCKEALKNLLKENEYLNDCEYKSVFDYRLNDEIERHEFDL